MARATAARSSASSVSVELTKTRSRWSGVRIAAALLSRHASTPPFITPPNCNRGTRHIDLPALQQLLGGLDRFACACQRQHVSCLQRLARPRDEQRGPVPPDGQHGGASLAAQVEWGERAADSEASLEQLQRRRLAQAVEELADRTDLRVWLRPAAGLGGER